MRKRMNKRGISAIVATILIILITVAGIVIIWTVILPMITQSLDNPELEGGVEIVSSGGYTVYDPVAQVALVQVRRRTGDADIRNVKITFLFGGTTNSSIVEAPGENQARTYAFNLAGQGAPDSVQVSPIYNVGDVERAGAVTSKVDIESSKIADVPNGDDLLTLDFDYKAEPACSNGAVGVCGDTDEGLCEFGTQTCSGGEWGACGGAYVGAVAEVCGNSVDEDCSGAADECAAIGGWVVDDTGILTGLDFAGTYMTSDYFEIGTEKYLITGQYDGYFKGYKWNGAGWDAWSTIVSGIAGDFGRNVQLEVFIDGVPYLLGWEEGNSIYIFVWTGTAWISTGGSGSDEMGDLAPFENWAKSTIFDLGDTKYLIMGEQSLFRGYSWGGSSLGWQTNEEIISGIFLTSTFYTPTVFDVGEDTYLIYGQESGDFVGYKRVGSSWIVNLDIASGLTGLGGRSAPETFYLDGQLYLISGRTTAGMEAWKWQAPA